jgi:DNA-binding response OmpR family regulator
MHALIIEDETYTAELLRSALTDLGFTSFAITASQREAMAFARDRAPDLVCADVTIAEGSGIAAALSICTDHIPAVFVTATPLRVEARIPDAIVIAKPFTLKNIYFGVGRALARSRARG